MLRLWPETIVLGLFPGQCTLRRGASITRRPCADNSSGAQLLDVLRSVLEGTGPFGRFAQAEVYVSDSLARIALLPWQSKLVSPIQVQAYGQACLESHGVNSPGEWAMHSGFRYHGATGMAAALPGAFVQQLLELLAQFGLRLRTVMPVTAATYWQYTGNRRAATSLAWLEESGRVTALAYSCGRLQALEVEPTLKQRQIARQRITKRLMLADLNPVHIGIWNASEALIDSALLVAQFGAARVGDIEGRRWA